jgi:hypothetical protein
MALHVDRPMAGLGLHRSTKNRLRTRPRPTDVRSLRVLLPRRSFDPTIISTTWAMSAISAFLPWPVLIQAFRLIAATGPSIGRWFGSPSSLICPAWLLMTQDQGNICVTNRSTGQCHAFERSLSYLRVRPRERMMPTNEMQLALCPHRTIRSTRRRTWAAIEAGIMRRPTPTMSHFR